MKIGKFSEENNLSLDAIRHYMELGLIIPIKNGGQYDFDERCKEDLEDIIGLKGMGFTLSEIRGIFFFKRLAKLSRYQEKEYYREFFNNKYKKVTHEIGELEKVKVRLGEKIEEMSRVEIDVGFKIGIDIRFLVFFRCLSCGGDMILSDGNIVDNQIISGTLGCKCGEEYRIDDGILIVPEEKDFNDGSYIDDSITEYISNTSIDYLDNICRGMEWVYKKLDFDKFKGKIFLDLGSGMGFGLRNVYDDLPDSSFYIAVDRDMEKHKFLKNMLETSKIKKNVIFICSDFLSVPIKDESVDVLVDFSGTSNYSFENESFLLKLVDRYVKQNAYLLGSYILFKNFSANSLISSNLRKNFLLEKVKEEIKELGYGMIDERASSYVQEGGKYESYFKKGEKVYTYIFYGKR
jgi:DNA-binding transcriptional MerR regulator/ubiquinone/menaquinone biosynthesis C-methylase UbiE